MNAIERRRKHSKINEPNLYPPAHNGLVADSSPAGPTSKSITYRTFISLTAGPPRQKRRTEIVGEIAADRRSARIRRPTAFDAAQQRAEVADLVI
jgi:hypothetical protein